jgi:serine/threonine protein kinase
MIDLTGKTIDEKYHILSLINEGGFGEVYEAKRIDDDEIVALKTILYPEYDDYYRRFQREIRIMETIDNENVIKILDYNLEMPSPYIVMPLAKCSLAEKVDLLKANEVNTLKIFILACKGIKALHEKGIYHRDIKPANILISQENSILISDLGLGKFEQRDTSTLTESSEYIGTALYMPPEFYSNRGYLNGDKRGDIYQLGKTLCSMLTGQNPSSLNIQYTSPSLQLIISKATADDPSNRYQSVDELITAIYHYLQLLSGSNNPEDMFSYYLDELNKRYLEEEDYDQEMVESMLHSLYSTKQSTEIFLDLFDKIPLELLKKLAQEMNAIFERIIQEYSRIMEELAEYYTYKYPYAEVIAERMKILHSFTPSIEYKITALKIVLKTSIAANRYAAMSIFNGMLARISNSDEGRATSIFLNEEMEHYSELMRIMPLNIGDLDHSLREVTRDAYARGNSEEEREMASNIDLNYEVDF